MITVINMVPKALSGETNQDSEPNISVDPTNPNQIAATAFTPDPMGGPNAPIYISSDGGATWSLNSIVPGSGQFGTGDITLRFSGRNRRIYAGILRGDISLRLNILRADDYAAATPMTVLVSRDQVDQPWVEAATVLSGPDSNQERVYVGNNNFASGGPAGRTATVDRSLNAATAPPPAGFGSFVIETRDTGTAGQDGPQVRTAIHADGTIYSVFYHWTAFNGGDVTSDIVVVRDDNWASGTNPYTALTDPSDNLPGRRVVTGITFQFNQVIGQERLGGNASIAVDPRDSATVYLAWADVRPSTGSTIHVTRSTDRGVTWSPDLRTVATATNCALAISSLGQIGFLYQQLTGAAGAQRWETHFERTDNAFGKIDDKVLSTAPADTPAATFSPYLGDYLGMTAVGRDFYGVFCANNTADKANFPQDVTYQRNANFTTHQLLGVDNTTPVDISIDPFFFKAAGTTGTSDFYVRDWTDSPTSGDDGAQPSTNPVFYATSDVWNRRSDNPGGFNASDQPQNENPQPFTLGDNFAFARIRRNAAGAPADVTAHFLYSEFGAGSNYQDANTGPDPTVSFAAGDTVQTMSNGYHWQLPPTTSTHLCLAVQITAPDDPFIPPGLVGRAPGWPTTDLALLNDNNKAQRNMGVYPVSGTGTLCAYAVVHNAATFRRSMTLRTVVDEATEKRLGDLQIRVIGDDRKRGRMSHLRPGRVIRLANMEPGENRWVQFCGEVPKGQDGALLPVHFQEVVEELVVNGFAIALQPSPVADVIHFALVEHGAAFSRLAAALEIDGAKEQGERALDLAKSEKISPSAYVKFLAGGAEEIGRIAKETVAALGGGDPFRLGTAARQLTAAVERGDAGAVLPLHQSFLNALDAHISMALKARGDLADVLQTVLWQRDLYLKNERLRTVPDANRLVERCAEFAASFGNRQSTIGDYPALTKELLDIFKSTATALAQLDLTELIGSIEEAIDDPQALQRANREFLLHLQEA